MDGVTRADQFALDLGSIRTQREAEQRGRGVDARKVEHSARGSHGMISARPHVIYPYILMYVYKHTHPCAHIHISITCIHNMERYIHTHT